MYNVCQYTAKGRPTYRYFETEAEAREFVNAYHARTGIVLGIQQCERPIRAYEIVDHGVDHAQYFQGCGVAFTDYELCVTGAGDNAREAYDDACEQLAQMGYDTAKLPTRPRGIRKTDAVRHADCVEDGEHDDFCELYYYVSIRVR